MKRWVYFVASRNQRRNEWARLLLTADDLADAEGRALTFLGIGWTAQHSEMICSTLDAPFIREV